ncbi:MAG: hypothetical protein AB7Q00_04380 [Phycisphaerales bacterium]|nr:MAG: hypothetical protein IPK69_09005 [Phycisphaerales bacterium]
MTLESHIGEIVQAEIDAVRSSRGSALTMRVGRVRGEAGCFRVDVTPARPVTRLAVVLDILSEAEERLEERYEGLRLMLIPVLTKTTGTKTPGSSRGAHARARRAVSKRKG